MNISSRFSSLILTASALVLSACSNSDFTGKAISNYIGDLPSKQCTPLNKTRLSQIETGDSEFEIKGKVLISETEFGEVQTSQSKASATRLPAGKRLVVVTDEECIRHGIAKGSISSNFESTQAPNAPSELSRSVELKSDVLLSDFISSVESDACVKGVADEVIYTLSAAPNDPSLSQEKHMPNIKAAQAYDTFYAADGIQEDVVIAIIDSGVDWRHQDLQANAWANPGETAGNGIDDDGNGKVDDIVGWDFINNRADPTPLPWTGSQAGNEIHGTHVAGLAAARSNNNIGVAGVNGEKAKIMGLNVFMTNGGGSNTAIDNAIRYAADEGAHVINMSLGGPSPSASTDSAMRYAVGKGTFIVIASGNENANMANGPSYPAAYSRNIAGVISVAATDSNTNARCSFSNYNGTYIEIAAPGCNGLYSTITNNRYQSLQGTSMASPVVAGGASLAIGLIKARKGSWETPAKVEEVLLAGSRVESGLTNAGMDVSKDKKALDLVALATEVNNRYGGSNSAPPPDGGGSNNECP